MKRFWMLLVVALGLAALACNISSAVVTMTPGVTPSNIPPTSAEMPAAPSAEITDAVPTIWSMIVCSDGLNIRSKPNATASIVGGLVRGQTVMVFESLDGWLRVGAGRWVRGSYLHADGGGCLAGGAQ